MGELKHLTEYALRTYNSHTDAPHFVTFETDEGFFIRFLIHTGADISIFNENFVRNKRLQCSQNYRNRKQINTNNGYSNIKTITFKSNNRP